MSFGWMEQWTDGRPDGLARSSGRLTRNQRFSYLQAESSDITLNCGIPEKTASLHTSDFVQTQNEANNTNTSFCLGLQVFSIFLSFTGLVLRRRN
jgi:hypothetical protein